MQDLLQCKISPSSFSNLSVLEKQRARLQLQQRLEFMDEAYNLSCDSLISLPILLQNPRSDQYQFHEFTNGCFPDAKGCSASSFKHAKEKPLKKRKTGKSPTADCVEEEAEKCKRRKAEASPEKSREIEDQPPPPPPPPKQDFIHVRARRGQATDSHSLAERVSSSSVFCGRNSVLPFISFTYKTPTQQSQALQGLVPGCDKITGKAGMLDEIINYVQSLQRQVEFLSMKLATASPWVDFDIDAVFPKEVNFACNPSIDIHTVGLSSHELVEPCLHMMNPMQQMAACYGLNMNTNVSELELALRRSLGSTLSVPQALFDESFEVDNSGWDANSESICGVDFHHEGKETMLALQSLPGNVPPSNLKMEM